MTVRSTSARAGIAVGCGTYQSARNNSASSMLPIKAKYRPRGMPITVVQSKTPECWPNGKKRQWFRATEIGMVLIGKKWQFRIRQ